MFSMNFRIKKHVDFGQAIYISGDIPQLGQWKIEQAFRLEWNQKDIWTGFIQLSTPSPQSIEYKYVIGNWTHPENSSLMWQDGNFNRQVHPQIKNSSYIIDDKWNMQKIVLNLMIPQNQDVYNNYSIIGNHIQLGNWKSKINLNKKNKNNKNNFSLQIDTDQDNLDDYNIYSYSFEIYRGREKFRYYYIRQAGHFCEPERHPGRLFMLGKDNSRRKDHFKTVYNMGKVEIYEKCDFRFLLFSKITDNLYLGAYPKTVEDIKKLKNQGINAIFSIQTQDDYNRHEVSEEAFHSVCKQQEIQSVSYAIKDMDLEQFKQKAGGALQILKKWSEKQYKIYVHCSAGIYRSPQLIILHLISAYNYDTQTAVKLVTQRHPYANPNLEVIFSASEKIKSKKLFGSAGDEKQLIIFKQSFEETDENGQNQLFENH